MSFDPRTEYEIDRHSIYLKDLHDYSEEYLTRPPYQRKTVWSKKKQQALLDSILRRYYIPNLVLRQVRLSEDRTIDEVIDGQQRITTVQAFFADEIRLPKSLSDLSSELAGKFYSEIKPEYRRFIDKLSLQADRIKNIEKKDDPAHQTVATEIFWRLQQGEALYPMEIAHARLSSPIRNFIVKFADDIGFDHIAYKPIENNENKHKFFRILKRGNNRMEHLSLLARFLLIERANGYSDIKDSSIQKMIDDNKTSDGIGSCEFENDPAAKAVLKTLNTFQKLFFNDPILKNGGVIQELQTEYFIISFYVLIRYLQKNYTLGETELERVRAFFVDFYQRWKSAKSDDPDFLQFSGNRQQGANDLRERDIVLRALFFDWFCEKEFELTSKDGNRAFNESQRINIYRRDHGICQRCIEEGISEKEATISWENFQADHIVPWSKGGETTIENAQLLCARHNQSKSAN